MTIETGVAIIKTGTGPVLCEQRRAAQIARLERFGPSM